MDPSDEIVAEDFTAFRGNLSPRLKQLMEANASGYTELETAHDLGISTSTIRHQMSILYGRLGLTGKSVKGRNKRVMLAWWWWNIGSKKP